MDERRALPHIPEAFQQAADLPVDEFLLQPSAHAADALLQAGGHRFLVEYKAAASTAQLAAAVRQLRAFPLADAIPLLVVPFMGAAGRELCAAEGLSWLDLSGNAVIAAPGLRVRVLDGPNRFKRPGRPTALFAARGSRLARCLLLEPARTFRQAELAEVTGLSPGFVSRLVRRYEEAGFVAREGDRPIRVRLVDPELLLEAWHAEYGFSEHELRRGAVAARSGMELLHRLADGLADLGVEYAATGLAAAWLWAPIAGFRLVTVYLRSWPAAQDLGTVGFHQGDRGSNVWLVRPADDGVFEGAEVVQNVRCASPVQVYLDLKGHPERAEEAAEELRRTRLTWPRDGG